MIDEPPSTACAQKKGCTRRFAVQPWRRRNEARGEAAAMLRAARFVLFHQPVPSRFRPRQRAARRPSAGGTALGTNRAPLKNAMFAIPSAAPFAAAPDLKRTPCPLALPSLAWGGNRRSRSKKRPLTLARRVARTIRPLAAAHFLCKPPLPRVPAVQLTTFWLTPHAAVVRFPSPHLPTGRERE
jgi:hypothetical protein